MLHTSIRLVQFCVAMAEAAGIFSACRPPPHPEQKKQRALSLPSLSALPTSLFYSVLFLPFEMRGPLRAGLSVAALTGRPPSSVCESRLFLRGVYTLSRVARDACTLIA
ncbi:hypothetical protein HPB50_015184 [Hyalomma asiaticum]|uniref:Uncharacterized protein n=1 Tax=Hyalomma asiaticum TaxID=266040 RepID=A0ACB7SQQ6_HYAAI|nr:hypothetical protein HPB50_015184 [Hyalomma asiaticum]